MGAGAALWGPGRPPKRGLCALPPQKHAEVLRGPAPTEGISVFPGAKRHRLGKRTMGVITVSKADASLSFLAQGEPQL